MSLLRVKFKKLLNESPARVCSRSHIAMNKLPFKTLCGIRSKWSYFFFCRRVRFAYEIEKYKALRKHESEWWIKPYELAT